jgi:hypothetical protein
MSARSVRLTLALGVLIGLIAACGTATTTGSPAAAGSSPTAVASAAPPSETADTSSEPSFALPSLNLPSGAKELEALLPSELCGSAAIKFSMSGDQLGEGTDKEFTDTLQTLGKSPSDVSFAAAGSTDGKCGAGIFRINGVDQNRLQEVFLNASKSEGGTFAPASVGGKNVFVVTTAGETTKQWAYFKGDAVLFVTADSEDNAASILSAMP